MAEGVWHQIMLDDGLGVAAKLVEQEDGRWIVTEMYLHGDRITASDLRNVQPARFEAVANAYDSKLERLRVEHQREHDQPEPTLAELRAGFEAAARLLEAPARDSGRPPRPQLQRPDKQDPEGFYQAVADAYRHYVKLTRAPAVKIAKEADVPVATAHRWIREARKRGFLPAGEQGRAG